MTNEQVARQRATQGDTYNTQRKETPMSLIDLSSLDLNNVPELHTLPDGSEARLVVSEVQSGVGQSGLTWLRLSMQVEGDELAKEVKEFVTIPDPKVQEPRKFAGSAQRFKVFLAAFNIGLSDTVDLESGLPGRSAWAVLGVKDNGEYGMENTVKRWLAPR